MKRILFIIYILIININLYCQETSVYTDIFISGNSLQEKLDNTIIRFAKDTMKREVVISHGNVFLYKYMYSPETYTLYNLQLPHEFIKDPKLVIAFVKKYINNTNTNYGQRVFLQKVVNFLFKYSQDDLFSNYTEVDFQEITKLALKNALYTNDFFFYKELKKEYITLESEEIITRIFNKLEMSSSILAEALDFSGLHYNKLDTVGLNKLYLEIDSIKADIDSLKIIFSVARGNMMTEFLKFEKSKKYSEEYLKITIDSLNRAICEPLERKIKNLNYQIIRKEQRHERTLSIVNFIAKHNVEIDEAIRSLNEEAREKDSLSIYTYKSYDLCSIIKLIGDIYLINLAPMLENWYTQNADMKLYCSPERVLARLQYKDYEQKMINYYKADFPEEYTIDALLYIRTQESLYTLAPMLLVQENALSILFSKRDMVYSGLSMIITNLPQIDIVKDNDYKKVYTWMRKNKGKYIIQDNY